MTEAEAEAMFFERHDADPRGVYLVTVFPEQRNAVFSTRAAVEAWLATLSEEVSTLTVPYVLNEPDYGNMRLQ